MKDGCGLISDGNEARNLESFLPRPVLISIYMNLKRDQYEFLKQFLNVFFKLVYKEYHCKNKTHARVIYILSSHLYSFVSYKIMCARFAIDIKSWDLKWLVSVCYMQANRMCILHLFYSRVALEI